MNLLTILLLLLLGGLIMHKYFFKSWTPYYQEKLYQEPRPLLIQALGFFKDSFYEKQALDLGAGAGNDIAYLLKHGWKVWANDVQEEAIKVIASRNDIQPYIHNLILMPKSFIDLPWDSFPQFDLI